MSIEAQTQVETLTLALQALDAEVTRLRSSLEIIAGQRQCIDNLLSHAEIARLTLAGPKRFSTSAIDYAPLPPKG